MSNSILMLQWLKQGEYREVPEVVQQFAMENRFLGFQDISSVGEFHSALQSLQTDSDCQFLFIGSHGIKNNVGECIGIGRSDSDYISWTDLWDVLASAKKPPVLWLGACSSTKCADAWSPIPTTQVAVEWIVGFNKDIYPEEIKDILKGLIDMTSLDPVSYADEEMPKLQKLVSGTCVQMHYLVHYSGQHRFLDTNQFLSVLGKTFKEHLEGK